MELGAHGEKWMIENSVLTWKRHRKKKARRDWVSKTD